MNKYFTLILIAITILFSTAISGCQEDPQSPDIENNSPISSAGTGKTILIGETAAFEGTASDADLDDTLSFSWSIISVPDASIIISADISNPDTLNASFTPDVPGEYTVRLTVSDGTNAASADAVVRAVGFVIGLNDNNNAECAYIHNGEFTPLDAPDNIDDPGNYSINTIEYTEGAVYTGGSFTYQMDGDWRQPVYWQDNVDHELIMPPQGPISCEITTLLVEPGGGIEAIVRNVSGDGDFYYYLNSLGYVSDSEAVSAAPAWSMYMVTEIFRHGDDVFQIGVAGDAGPTTFFMAKNGAEIVHSTSYVPNPVTDSDFDVHGTLFIRDADSDSDSKVYLYGRWRDADDYYHACYTVNDGSRTDIAPQVYVEGYNHYISYMDSLENYIYYYTDFSDTSTSVFAGGTELTMQIPHEGETEVIVSNLEHFYIEEIDGSIFVAGGYTYSDFQQNFYNVAVIWRDGTIVFEDFDNDYSDGLNYDLASIEAADFY